MMEVPLDRSIVDIVKTGYNVHRDDVVGMMPETGGEGASQV